MFSGIVDHCGELISIETRPEGVQFWIAHQFKDTLNLGESVAIDGACLTIVDLKEDQFAFELSPDTLRVTIAKEYEQGQRLNLELAMRLNDRVGGHLVTGHVEQSITVSSIKKHDAFTEVHFSNLPKEAQRFLVKKGSVTINGVSLTVNEVENESFSIMLIPHTLERTNLSALKTGQRVNVEWDYMAKLVDKQISLYLKPELKPELKHEEKRHEIL